MHPQTKRDEVEPVDPRQPLFQGLIRGMLPLYLLFVLKERPRHGTELIRFLAAMSGDTWRPSPGSVYPVLRKLEKEGLLSGRWRRGQAAPKRVYRLTDKGHEELPSLRDDLLKQLRLARELIDMHIEALEQGGEGFHHGRR